jgi:lipopolysaccharide transport system ATP-binding protein
MSDRMVVVEDVWKKFSRGERHDSLRDLVPSMVRRMLGRVRPSELESKNDFWAVKGVSFEVRRGEAFGIIGPNGAGKSTLLKLLTRILKPTRGNLQVRGQVGALIEVSAGFHGDLTGRENVYMQGAVMGMKRAEIARKLDEIVEFAGLSAFIDTPVKRYSSGMNARLGFSIAAHLDPDVLLIDEVLAVGDMAFQAKCVDRMKQFKRDGAAIVFISHQLASVADLCDRAALMLAGETQIIGPTEAVIDRYFRSAHLMPGAKKHTAATLENIQLVDERNQPVSACKPGTAVRLSARVVFHAAARNVSFGMGVHQSSTGIYAYGLNSASAGVRTLDAEPGDAVDVSFAFQANLTRGDYMLELQAVDAAAGAVYALNKPAAVLRVDETLTPHGVADLAARCDVRAVHLKTARTA